MKVIIYRNKKTNEIVGVEEAIGSVTQEMLDNYNSKDCYEKYVEFDELQENGVAYYLFKAQIQSKQDYCKDMRNLEEMISNLAYTLDHRLSEIERMS